MISAFAPAPTLTERQLSSSVQGDGERNLDTQDAMVDLVRRKKEIRCQEEEEAKMELGRNATRFINNPLAVNNNRQ